MSEELDENSKPKPTTTAREALQLINDLAPELQGAIATLAAALDERERLREALRIVTDTLEAEHTERERGALERIFISTVGDPVQYIIQQARAAPARNKKYVVKRAYLKYGICTKR